MPARILIRRNSHSLLVEIQKRVRCFFKKLNTVLTCDPGIEVLDIYLTNFKIYLHKTCMKIEALLIITQNCK